MKFSMKASLDSVLQKRLAAIRSLPEDARAADESIMAYLKQKVAEALAREYRSRSNRKVDEAAVLEWAARVVEKSTAPQMYAFFDAKFEGELSGFWEKLDFTSKKPIVGFDRDMEDIIEAFRRIT
jgi:Na+/phosphate symporter